MEEFKINGIEDFLILEKDRFESFKSWPFDENAVCNTKKMAEAGFYWCGNLIENDSATCFACGKVLDGWESTDDPWSEHKKHAPQCVFVKTEKPENKLTLDEFLNIFRQVCIEKMKTKHNKKMKKVETTIAKNRDEFVKSFEK